VATGLEKVSFHSNPKEMELPSLSTKESEMQYLGAISKMTE